MTMDIIEKSALIGGIYLVISIIYVNMPFTKRKIQRIDDQKLFQKHEKFKISWKIFLATGFFSPIILVVPLFFTSKSEIIKGYLAFFVLVVICAIATGIMYLNLAKITVGEIEYRKSKEKNAPKAPDRF